MQFADKVIIITGCSSGIGAAASEHFSSLKAKVVITGRNEEKLKETAKKCVGEILLIVADVNSESDRLKIINDAISKYGRIDVLVNNAGIGESEEFSNFPMEKFDSIFNTNVRSVFHLTQLAIPYLIESKGNIVNTSSVVSFRAFPGYSAYGMSKAALDQFTRCLALELAPKGVRVNSVNPSTTITNFHKRMGMDEEKYQAYLIRAGEAHPLGRAAEAHEVVEAIAFLANNNESSFITGTILSADGGKSLLCQR